MAWAIVQNPACSVATIGSNTASSLTVGPPTLATTAGNSLIVIIFGTGFSGQTIGVSDSAGNTYTVDQQALGSGVASVAIASAHRTASLSASSGSVTVTLTTAIKHWGFQVLEFAPGAARVSYDTGAAGTTGGNPATPSAGPTGTVAGGQELVIEAAAFVASSGSRTISTTGWTATYVASLYDFNTGIRVYGAGAYEAVTGSGTYTGSEVQASSGGGSSVAVIAVYKAANGGTYSGSGGVVFGGAAITYAAPPPQPGGSATTWTPGATGAVLALTPAASASASFTPAASGAVLTLTAGVR